MTKKTIRNIDSNQAMTQWFKPTVDFVDLFGLSLSFLTFLAFIKFCRTFCVFHSNVLISINSWFKQYLKDSNRFNSDSSGFPGIDSESTHDSKWILQVLIQID